MSTTKITTKTPVTSITDTDKVIVSTGAGVAPMTLPNFRTSLFGGIDLNAMEDGVFIMAHRKSNNAPMIVKPHKWASFQNNGEIAEGVALFEGGRHIVVAPTESDTKLNWSSAAISGGGFASTDLTTAISDFAGRANTTAQIAHNECSASTYAAGFCNAYSRTNINGQGLTAGRYWLPSLGELIMIYANLTKINYALSLISGATPIAEDAYWSSTECTTGYALYCDIGNGVGNNLGATMKFRVRPVSAFIR